MLIFSVPIRAVKADVRGSIVLEPDGRERS